MVCRHLGQSGKNRQAAYPGKARLLVLFKEARVISPDLILEKFHLVVGMFSACAQAAG